MVCVTLVGVTGLLQIWSIMASLQSSVEDYYAATRFRDVEITFSAGLSEDSLTRIDSQITGLEMEGVTRLAAVMCPSVDPSSDEYWEREATDIERYYPVHIVSQTDRISTPVLVEGRLPETEQECAVDVALAQRVDLAVGDWVDLRKEETGSRQVHEDTFIITGLIYHPNTVTSMRADTVLLAHAAFKDPGMYTSILVMLDIPTETQRKALSGSYLTLVEERSEELRSILPEITSARLEEVQMSMEENESLQYMLGEYDLTMRDLLDWIGGEDPSWESADPRIQAIRPDIEGLLQGYGLTLEEAAAMYREMEGSTAVVLDRTMNDSYEYVRNMFQTISRIGYFLAPLFALVAGIVFFSSTAIMINDQKYQVGAMKAIGFSEQTIRRKYVLFGTAAALTGSIAGTVLCAVINVRILRKWDEQFSIGGIRPRLPLAEALILTAAFLVGAVIVVRAACRRLLSCSASGLMNGSEPKQKTLTDRNGRSRKATLYSELIINNIRLEKPRVIAMLIVVAVSVMMIGIGITIRTDLDETFRTQAEDVVKYDIEVRLSGQADTGYREDFESLLERSGCTYAKGYEGEALATVQSGTFGCSMLCMERNLITDYFHVSVPADEGITLSYNLSDAYGIKKGDTVSLYSRMLTVQNTQLADVFEYHIGNMMVIPADEYYSMYGSTCQSNRYYIKCTADQKTELMESFAGFNKDRYDWITVEVTEETVEQFYPLRNLYDMILAVTLVLTVLTNLIVMVNLTNILIDRRMRDLLLMRVNGFSMRQVKEYFYREMFYTVLPGIILGIAAGVPLTLFMLRRISTMKVTLVVETVWYAWVIAAGTAAVLAVAVATVSFKKVRNASLTHIPRE